MTGDDAATLATGDAVNTAKRLEEAAGGGEILIGRVTERLVRHAVAARGRVVRSKRRARALQSRPGACSASIAGADSFARRWDTPLVGRTDELGVLRDGLTASADGRECRLVTVIGAAGVGKTRLVSELVAEVGGYATVAVGPLPPLRRRDHLLAADGAHPAARRRAGGGGSGWARIPTRHSSSSAFACSAAAGAAPPEELFWAVRRLFELLARERPLLVVLEDVHWAEPMLLDLVEHVSRWSRDAPILLLCVARPELLEERPQWEGVHVRLEPLSSGEATQLLDALDARRHPLAGTPRPRDRGRAGESALRRAARRDARRGGPRGGRARHAAADDPGAARRAARPPRSGRARGAPAGSRRRQGVLARSRGRPRTAGTRVSGRRCSASSAASSSSPPSRAFPARTASGSGTP